jgi:Kef-type K+ transport system membrane component KefB
MKKPLLVYGAMIFSFGILLAVILHFGSHLQSAIPSQSSGTSLEASPGDDIQNFYTSLQQPIPMLLLQIVAIIIVARAMGFMFEKINQPAVIGEMIAGILLGPSLLGILSPKAEAFLFPTAAMDILKMLSQLGVILFMFSVGLELDVQTLRRKAHAAVMVSHAGILMPFIFGAALALLLYPLVVLSKDVPFSAFGLFMGIAMSITAFPVLARILEERGLAKSQIGATAIACAAVDDATAWCGLAIVVAVVKSSGMSEALLTILLTLAFVGMMLFLIRPSAGCLLRKMNSDSVPGRGQLVLIFAFVFTSALVTEAIGIHALFGAFLAGIVLSQDANLRKHLKQNIEMFTSAFLLPLFFAYTGLRTQIGLLASWQSWLICAGIISVAIMGKFGGSTLAARLTGMSWFDSASIGALMNTRGLMELIALNIGYDLGILPPQIFAMMVLMALATTFMTSPLLSFFTILKERALPTPTSIEST